MLNRKMWSVVAAICTGALLGGGCGIGSANTLRFLTAILIEDVFG